MPAAFVARGGETLVVLAGRCMDEKLLGLVVEPLISSFSFLVDGPTECGELPAALVAREGETLSVLTSCRIDEKLLGPVIEDAREIVGLRVRVALKSLEGLHVDDDDAEPLKVMLGCDCPHVRGEAVVLRDAVVLEF